MATDGYVHATRIGALSTALGPKELFARRNDVEEGISELFTFRVEAISADENVDFDDAIGHNATFCAKTPRGMEQHFDSILNIRYHLAEPPADADRFDGRCQSRFVIRNC